MNKRIKILLILLFFMLVVSVCGVTLINGYVKSSVSESIQSTESLPTDKTYDCIFVLGCGVRPDGTPSGMLEDRLKRATELYRAGFARKIIMSGDHGTKGYDEVNTMRSYALNCGIPAEDIFMDHAGFSTYESIYRAKEIFCVKSMLIVTQEYHLYRALYIAKRLGIDALGVSSDYHIYYGQKMRDIREVAARCKDFFSCIIKPEPTYLGEAIPVSGNGTVTVD